MRNASIKYCVGVIFMLAGPKTEDLRRYMKIVVVGLGYVGLSNAVLLAQNNEVIGVDTSQERIDMLNARKSPSLTLSFCIGQKRAIFRQASQLA